MPHVAGKKHTRLEWSVCEGVQNFEPKHYAVPEDPQQLAHNLIPLKLAAEVVWNKVYAARHGAAKREDKLISIALTLCAMGDVFQYEPDSRRVPRRLSPSDMDGGLFRAGGQELNFIDGRATIRYLAVEPDCVSKTIEALKKEL